MKKIIPKLINNFDYYKNKIVHLNSLNNIISQQLSLDLELKLTRLNHLKITHDNKNRIDHVSSLVDAYKKKSSKTISFGSIDYQNDLIPLEERKLKVNGINTTLYGDGIEDPLYPLEIKAFMYKIHSYLTYSSDVDSVKLLKLQSYIILSDVENINRLFAELIEGFTDKLKKSSTNDNDISYFFHILRFSVSLFALLNYGSNYIMEKKGELIDIVNFNDFFNELIHYIQKANNILNKDQIKNIENKLSSIFINYTWYASYYKDIALHNEYFESIHPIFGDKIVDVLTTFSFGAYYSSTCSYSKIASEVYKTLLGDTQKSFDANTFYNLVKLSNFLNKNSIDLCKLYVENKNEIIEKKGISFLLDILGALLEDQQYYDLIVQEVLKIHNDLDLSHTLKLKSGFILISSYIKTGMHNQAKELLLKMLHEEGSKNSVEAMQYINFMHSLSMLVDEKEEVYNLYYQYIFLPIYKGSLTVTTLNIFMKTQLKISRIYNFLELQKIYNSYLKSNTSFDSKNIVIFNPYTDNNNYYSPLHIYKNIVKQGIPIINLCESEINFFNERKHLQVQNLLKLSYDNDSIIGLQKHWKDLFCIWEVSFENKQILCNGINMYQTFFETVARAQKKFSIDWNSGISQYYFKLFQRRVDRNAFIYEKLKQIFPNKSIKFFASMYHYTPWSYYYSRFRSNDAPAQESLIQINAAYENFKAHEIDETFASITALNLTLNKKSRAVAFGSSEHFSRWVESRFDTYKLKHKDQQLITDCPLEGELKLRIEEAKSQGKIIVCILGKLLYDLCVPYMGGTFSDMHEWAKETNDFVLERDDIFLLVKPHPHEIVYSVSNVAHESFHNWFSDDKKKIYKVKHKEASPSDLAPYVDLFLLWNGTSVIELAKDRRNIIACDDWANNDYPIGLIQPQTKQQYFQSIIEAKKWDPNSPIAFKRAKMAELYEEHLSSREFTVENIGVIRSSTNTNWNVPYLKPRRVIDEFIHPTQDWNKIMNKIFEV